MHIGKAIEFYRKKRNLTTTKLANLAGLSQSTISKYEKGERNPSDDAVEAIAKALNISVQELLDKAQSFHDPVTTYTMVQARKRLEHMHDIVIPLSNRFMLIGDISVIDLLKEKRKLRVGRVISAAELIITEVLTELLEENREEINRRILDKLGDTEEILRNLNL